GEVLRLKDAPIEIGKTVADIHKMVDQSFVHFIHHMFAEIYADDPAPLINDIFVPLFVVGVVGVVKIEHIFPDEDELIDTLADKYIYNLPLQKHDVITDRIVPFPNEFNNSIAQIIVRHDEL